MSNHTAPEKTAVAKSSPAEKQKAIDGHKKAANHFESAAKHHIEAAKHHEADNHEKAAISSIAAHGHQILGKEAQRENIKNQVLISHPTK